MQKLKALVVTLFLVCSSTPLLATTPILTFEGTFSDSASGLLRGAHNVSIQLRASANVATNELGTLLWEESLNNVVFSEGFMSVELGKTTAINQSLFARENLSFIVEIDGVTGKVAIPLRYVPFAVQAEVAKVANAVDGANITGTIPPTALSAGAFSNITGLGTLTATLNVDAALQVQNQKLVVSDSHSRVGINNANPAHTLDVGGDIRLTGTLIFPDGSTMNTGIKPQITSGDETVKTDSINFNADSDKNGSGQITFKVGDVERFVILNDTGDGIGRSGVGVKNPVQEFEVNGAILVRDTTLANAGAIRFHDNHFEGYDGTAWRRLDLLPNTGGGWSYLDIPQLISPVSNLVKVGIGTTLPTEKLEVAGTISANRVIATFQGDGANITNLAAANLSGVLTPAQGGTGTNTYTDGAIVYYSASANALLSLPVMQAGEFLIGDGTGSPNVAQLVSGNGIAIEASAHGVTINHVDTSSQATVTQNNGNVIQSIYLDTFGHVTQLDALDLDTRYFTESESTARFYDIAGDTLTGSMVFSGVTISMTTATINQHIVLQPQSGGYVGIGHTQPQEALDVSGAIRISGTTSTAEGIIRYDPISKRFEGRNDSSWIALDNQTTTAGGWTIASPLVYLANILHRVGIGTESPEEKLHVVGTALVSGNLRVSGSMTLDQNLDLGSRTLSDGTFSGGDWTFSNGSVSAINTLSATTVGVGVASPGAALHVSGNGIISGNASIGGTLLTTGTATFPAITVGSSTIGSGTLSGDWDFGNATVTGIASLTVDNMTLDGNTWSAVSGNLNLTPTAASSVVIDGHFGFDGNTMTALTNENTTINAFGSRALVLEGVQVQDQALSNITNATMSGTLTVDSGTFFVDSVSNRVAVGTTAPSANNVFQIFGGDVVIGHGSVVANPTSKSDLFVEGDLIVDGRVVQSMGSASIFEDIQVKGNTFLTTVSGKVGIGTTDAGAQLDIATSGNTSGTVAFRARNSDDTTLVTVRDDGTVGIGHTTPAATLHVAAGTNSRPSLIIEPGNLLTTPVAGAIEINGDNLYVTSSGPTRNTVVTTSGNQTLINKSISGGSLDSVTVSGDFTTTTPFAVTGNNAITLIANGEPLTMQGSNFSVAADGTVSLNILSAGNIAIAGDTIQDTVATLNIKSNGEVNIEEFLVIDGTNRLLYPASDGDLTINGFTGKSVVIETINLLDGSLTVPNNLTVDTSTLVIDAANNAVGLGTASPQSGTRMHVLGDALIGGAGVISNSSGSSDLYVEGNLVLGGNIIQKNSTDNQLVSLETQGNTALATANGEVRIGASSSGAKLNIKGHTAGSTLLAIEDNAGNNVLTVKDDGAGGVRIGVGTSEPGVSLQVIGTLNATTLVGNAAGITGISTLWQKPGGDLYYTSGNVGIGVSNPSGLLELGAGTTARAPLVFRSGTLLSTEKSGAIEYDGTNLYFTDSGTNRRTLVTLDGTQTLTSKTLTSPVINGGGLSGTLNLNSATTLSGSNTLTLSPSTLIASASNFVLGSNGVASLNAVTTDEINGQSTLTLNAVTAVVIDDHFKFTGSSRALTGLTDGDTVIDAFANRNVIIEGISLKDNTLTVPSTTAIDGNTLFVDASNNTVGIGTTTPVSTASMQILGDVIIGPGSTVHNESAAADLFIKGNLVVDGQVYQSMGSSNTFADVTIQGQTNLSTSSGEVSIGSSSSGAKVNIKTSGAGVTALKIVDSSDQPVMYVKDSKRLGIGHTDPQASLHILAGTSGQAPIILNSGTLLGTTVAGAIEFDGTDLYVSVSGPTRNTLVNTNRAQTLSNKTVTGSVIGNVSVTGNWTTVGNLAIGNANFPISFNTGSQPLSITASNWTADTNGFVTVNALTVDDLYLDASTMLSRATTLNLNAVSGVQVQGHHGFSGTKLIGQSDADSIFEAYDGRKITVEDVYLQDTVVSNVSKIQLIGDGEIEATSTSINVTAASGKNINFTTTGGGDFTVNSMAFVVDQSSGRVGIGTASPSEALNVVGSANISSTLTAGKFVGDGSGLFGLDSLWKTESDQRIYYTSANVGIGRTQAKGLLHLGAGTTTTASLVIDSGTLLATEVAGAIEFDGSALYYTITSGPTRKTIVDTDTTQTLSNKTFNSGSIGNNAVSGTWTMSNPLQISGGSHLLTLGNGTQPVTINAASSTLGLKSSNWRIGDAGNALLTALAIDNITLDTNTLSATSGTLNLTAANGLTLDSNILLEGTSTTRSILFVGGDAVLQSDTGTVSVEEIKFSGSTISGITGLSLSDRLVGAAAEFSQNIHANALGLLAGIITSNTSISVTPVAGRGVSVNLSANADFHVSSGAGVEFAVDTSTGRVGIGTSTPAQDLDVVGTIKGTSFIGDGSALTGIDSKWQEPQTGTIHYSAGRVGIGTATPTAPLTVASANGVLFAYDGTLSGDTPNSGGEIPFSESDTQTGVRLMWYPGKAAFRLGGVSGSSSQQNYWRDANIGTYSIAMGSRVMASANYSAVLSGYENRSLGLYGVVAGGNGHNNGMQNASIGGGATNTIVGTGTYGVIAGGQSNTVTASHGVVAGGSNNVAGGQGAFVGGGDTNKAYFQFSTISGGDNNTTLANNATVGGGANNSAEGLRSTISGGGNNATGYDFSTVGGGSQNQAGDNPTSKGYAVVSGGELNKAYGAYGAIGGGKSNEIDATLQTGSIGGGESNKITAPTSTGQGATIAGGKSNTVERAQYGAILGGNTNGVGWSDYAVVVAGRDNTVTGSASYSTVVAGRSNTISSAATHGFIGGGQNNSIAGAAHATIPGGLNNRVLSGASYALAGGYNATVGSSGSGSFAWSADNSGAGVTVNVADTIVLRADKIWVGSENITVGSSQVSNGFLNVGNGAYLTHGGTWTNSSDVNKKENFVAISPALILSKVMDLQLSTWNYKAEPDSYHLGPTAQDFHEAFGLGNSDKSIATIDSAGVNMAAIQGLHQLVTEKQTKIETLEARIQALETQVQLLLQAQGN